MPMTATTSANAAPVASNTTAEPDPIQPAGVEVERDAALRNVELGLVREGKLVNALSELLDDTQHKDHLDCEDGGYCPVRDARAVLEEWLTHWEAVAARAPAAASQGDRGKT